MYEETLNNQEISLKLIELNFAKIEILSISHASPHFPLAGEFGNAKLISRQLIAISFPPFQFFF